MVIDASCALVSPWPMQPGFKRLEREKKAREEAEAKLKAEREAAAAATADGPSGGAEGTSP